MCGRYVLELDLGKYSQPAALDIRGDAQRALVPDLDDLGAITQGRRLLCAVELPTMASVEGTDPCVAIEHPQRVARATSAVLCHRVPTPRPPAPGCA